MVKAIGVAVPLLLASLAAVLGAPVEPPISFSTTVSPLAAAHNDSVMSSACVHMTPVHGEQGPQKGVAPYTLRVVQEKAVPGDTVQVKIHSLDSEGFRGLYIQGRHGEVPVGQFLQPVPSSLPVKLSDCLPGLRNAASYISRQPITELTLDYVVPDVTDVVFTATFVKSYSEFWVGVVSEALLVSKNNA